MSGAELRLDPAIEAIAKATADGILVTDGQSVVFANGAMAALLGRSLGGSLEGMSLGAVLSDRDVAAVQRLLLGEGPQADQERAEWTFRRDDGRSVALEVAMGGALDCGGRRALILVVRHPSSASKLHVRMLQADRMASIGTLAAGVAHEINNPLAYVLANLEFVTAELAELAAEAPNERVEEMLQALREAREGAERVRHIVRDLKTFARPNEEDVGPVDLRRVIEASINMVFNEIKHRARLIKDYGQTPLVRGNESRLGQVFLNVLLNAAQAIPDGHYEENRIRIVTGEAASGRVFVEIQDTGCGMPPEVKARVFEPFFTTKPVGVGTGLGLPICRDIVVSLGGDIEVESEQGVGTTIRIVLPAAEAEEESAPSPEGTVPPGRRGRVLVVDDEPMVLSAVRRAIAADHEVVTEGSAARALARLQAGETFDLILCDLMMPQISGMDLWEEISAEKPELAERLVFLTGGAFTARAREFLDRVQNPRVEKPFEPQQLRSLVRSLVG